MDKNDLMCLGDEYIRTLHSTLAIYHVIVFNTGDVYNIGHSEMSVSVEKVANDTSEFQWSWSFTENK